MTNYLRPDEMAAESEIERAKQRDFNLKRGVKTAVGLGTAAIGGLGLSSKVLPFLNKYITPELAMKGINKVAPKIGQFLETGIKQGLNLQDGLNFIKDNMQGQSQIEHAKEQRNIIEQYSPELHQFMTQEIQKGRSPIEAAALAQNNKKFADVIKKLSKTHKANWSAIVESIYGGGQMAQQPPQAQPIQQQPTQPQGQQQGPSGDDALLAAIDKILKM
jgi:hypothetical protein